MVYFKLLKYNFYECTLFINKRFIYYFIYLPPTPPHNTSQSPANTITRKRSISQLYEQYTGGMLSRRIRERNNVYAQLV